MTSASTPKVSRGLRVLSSSSTSTPNKDTTNEAKAEREALMKEIALIEQWWRDPRWKGTKRTYSGESSVIIMVCVCMMGPFELSNCFTIARQSILTPCIASLSFQRNPYGLTQPPMWPPSATPPKPAAAPNFSPPNAPSPTAPPASSTSFSLPSTPGADTLIPLARWIPSR